MKASHSVATVIRNPYCHPALVQIEGLRRLLQAPTVNQHALDDLTAASRGDGLTVSKQLVHIAHPKPTASDNAARGESAPQLNYVATSTTVRPRTSPARMRGAISASRDSGTVSVI